jgi:ubiquinone biosynthesis protein Coq4
MEEGGAGLSSIGKGASYLRVSYSQSHDLYHSDCPPSVIK